MQKLGCTALAVLMLGACSQQNSGDTPGDDNTATASSAIDDGEERAVRPPTDPFPSTYKPYPSDVVLIAGATILTGAGEQIDDGSILMQDGKIMAVGAAGNVETPDGARVIDAEGKWVTPGIIDVHAHLGNDPAPANPSTRDVGEWGSPNTAQSWVEHGVWPQDAAFARALAGGLTSMQVLPGSGNLFSGRSVILKNVPERTVQGMKFPDAPYGIKMACGENPRSMFGSKGGPSTRMGNMSGYREAWIEAERYKKSWEDYWQAFEEWTGKDEDKPEAPDRDLKVETLAGVLSGDINVSMHCYRADEMVFVIDMAKEFGYQVNAFHHAVEAYKVADYLAENGICAAVWADWWGFKMEAYDGVLENAALVHAQPGSCAIIHSDSETGIQRLNQEAAKAMDAGQRIGLDIQPKDAIAWITANAAKSIGILDQTGTLETGKMADVVIWSGNPFSVYTKAELVFIDGALIYDRSDPERSPRVDFEIGQLDYKHTGGAGQ